MVRLFAAAAAIALLAAPLPGVAQDAQLTPEQQLERLNAASDLVETLNLRQMMNQLSSGTTTALTNAVAQTGEVNDETRAAISTAVRNNMAERLPEIIPLLAPVTAEAFTPEEIAAMNEFYGTDLGQSIINKLPGYQGASSRLMASWMQANTQSIQAAILEDLTAAGIEIPAQAPAQ